MSAAASPQLRVLMFPKHDDNPFVRRFSAGLEAAGQRVDDFTYGRALTRRYDVLHLHWPDSHLASRSWWGSLFKHARLAALLAYLRLRGTRIVWMIHNLSAHDRNHWLSARLFALWFPRACTHVIALTESGLQSARARYPSLTDSPATIVPHGHYRDEYPQPPARCDCRTQLHLPQDRFTFLFFGNVRRYKNVPRLIAAFREISSRDVQLVVAGRPGHEISAEELSQLSAGDDRISLRLEFIPDAAVPTYFGAADVVVLPFDGILNSGSVLLALSFNRAILAPRLGALPDIQGKVGSRWLQLYEGPLSSAMLLDVRAAQSAADAAHAGQREVDLSAFDWNSIADRTLELYRRGSAGEAPGGVATIGGASEGDSYDTARNEYSKT